ncbi:hypothetical protein DH2020_047441 [Rehmannia glutinosa]|uniref:WAT1-related protein n=1 Tax=Rehmannia glutinosa TaxID=99300 RepID=A0ABR0U8N0_REHGL
MGKAYGLLVNILEKHKCCLAMIFVQLAFAGMAMFSKVAITNGMNPYVFVAYRQAFATITLAPFAFFLDRKKADPMSYGLIWKIFLISLFGITLSLNLYSYAINYVSATFASASINTIPTFTFVIAVAFRIESFSIREFPGIAKFVGSVVSLSGAMVFAFVKGPQVKFLNWCSGTQQTNVITHLSTKKNWIKGCLLMLSANTAWASWLVMQGVVVTGISYWLQLWAVEKKGPLYAATFTPLILILLLSSQHFCGRSICGGILLVGGLYCVIWGKNKEAEKEVNGEKQMPKRKPLCSAFNRHIL